ncbi:MAG: circadian clock KaiB family protein [Nostoc sp. ChiSLP02]|nr:circadian clock KaiB family protein [Nostoc sp. DedSLP05]MDZ8103180.1 circadian clock KaiB family protein [Nostoc sp. DedSLP01]MDZ8188069.1 circadian clock KaiB family protein [Nostoc sp. ChiSLP02]
MVNELSQEDSDDMTVNFEQAIANRDRQQYRLRLYIAGTTPRSMRALETLKLLCETHLHGRYELEVIDVYQSSQKMGADNIIAIPTLVKQLPLPLRRIIGDLSNIDKVLLGLDLVAK